MKLPRDMTLAEIREALKGTGSLAVKFAAISYEAEIHLIGGAINERHEFLKPQLKGPLQ